MNISEKLVAIFILLAVGFFGLNMAHSKMSNQKTTKASISAAQVHSLN